MITSMTGYGRGDFKKNGIEACVEIRSFNNRFLEVSVRLPKIISHCDQLVKELIRKYISRGRINISVTLQTENDTYLGLKADIDLAKAYKRLLIDLKESLSIPGDVKIEHLISLPDLIIMEGDEERAEDVWEVVEQAIEIAAKELMEMRKREGQELLNDLKKRLKILDKSIKEIETLSADRSQVVKNKLFERIAELLNIPEIDEKRLEQEVAILAERMDVTEECVRFQSHNKLFIEALSSFEPPGRKLNFILQEMNREANTIGAKANDADISHIVVSIKEEIEKIREQVQNIE